MADAPWAGGPRYAAFVSPHGFGHAARAAAVMEAAHRDSGATWEVFTTVPRWFFDESVGGIYRYHETVCDVGFRQRSALEYDLDGTVHALQALLPFDPRWVDALASRVRATGCSAVLCDVAPVGIAVAERAGLPSVLVENFSWSWLYAPLVERAPALGPLSAELDRWWSRATVHVQTEPLCARDPDADHLVGPISREPRRPRAEVRDRFGLPAEGPVVVLTMGGVGQELPFVDRLGALEGVTFLVTGLRSGQGPPNVRAFPNDTPIFMPDLLRASDAIVAKLGYGTVAETWREGLPFASVTRADFAEMASLEAFVDREVPGFRIAPQDFPSGDWIERVPELLAMPRTPHEGNAASRVARLLAETAAPGA